MRDSSFLAILLGALVMFGAGALFGVGIYTDTTRERAKNGVIFIDNVPYSVRPFNREAP